MANKTRILRLVWILWVKLLALVIHFVDSYLVIFFGLQLINLISFWSYKSRQAFLHLYSCLTFFFLSVNYSCLWSSFLVDFCATQSILIIKSEILIRLFLKIQWHSDYCYKVSMTLKIYKIRFLHFDKPTCVLTCHYANTKARAHWDLRTTLQLM